MSVEVADVSRRADLEALARRVSGPLDVLIQNAATAPHRRQETPEGIEVQLATNVLAYLWLAEALLPALERAAAASQSRIVNVASYWAGDLDLADLGVHTAPLRQWHGVSAVEAGQPHADGGAGGALRGARSERERVPPR